MAIQIVPSYAKLHSAITDTYIECNKERFKELTFDEMMVLANDFYDTVVLELVDSGIVVGRPVTQEHEMKPQYTVFEVM